MSTIYVREQGATVRRRGERLVVTKNRDELLDTPLLHVDQVALIGNVQLSTPALSMLMKNDVDVVYFTRGLGFRARVVSNGSKFAALRVAQLRAMDDPPSTLKLAKSIVAAKLSNQRVLLQRRLRERRTDEATPDLADLGVPAASFGAVNERLLREAVDGIGGMMKAGVTATTLDSLRGHEGKAGAFYFGGLKALIEAKWGFTGRHYHPAPDPVNAALSFGYALLQRDAEAAVQMVGLDPCIGFLHQIDYGRPSLALDLMEEFRPVLVDTLVLSLIDRRELTPADFRRTGKAERPIELSPSGRDTLIKAYELRIADQIQHPVDSQRHSYRRIIELQARQVANVVLGKADTYQGIVLR